MCSLARTVTSAARRITHPWPRFCSGSGTSASAVEEAAWIATNLAAGSHATVAALVPAAPILIAHLGGSAGQAVAVQSAWALGARRERLKP